MTSDIETLIPGGSIGHFIGGETVLAGERFLDVFEPATGRVQFSFPSHN